MTTLRSLLTPDKPDAPAPHLDRLTPIAAMPGGEIDVHGQHLDSHGAHIPRATIGDIAAPVTLTRPTPASIPIPERTITGNLTLHRHGTDTNPPHLPAPVPIAANPPASPNPTAAAS